MDNYCLPFEKRFFTDQYVKWTCERNMGSLCLATLQQIAGPKGEFYTETTKRDGMKQQELQYWMKGRIEREKDREKCEGQ